MTLDELKEDEWYKERPEIIRQAIDILPPITIYQFKDTKKQCYIVAYNEPVSGLLEDVTLIVQKIGKGGVMAKYGLGILDVNQVFDVRLDDLEPINT